MVMSLLICRMRESHRDILVMIKFQNYMCSESANLRQGTSRVAEKRHSALLRVQVYRIMPYPFLLFYSCYILPTIFMVNKDYRIW